MEQELDDDEVRDVVECVRDLEDEVVAEAGEVLCGHSFGHGSALSAWAWSLRLLCYLRMAAATVLEADALVLVHPDISFKWVESAMSACLTVPSACSMVSGGSTMMTGSPMMTMTHTAAWYLYDTTPPGPHCNALSCSSLFHE